MFNKKPAPPPAPPIQKPAAPQPSQPAPQAQPARSAPSGSGWPMIALTENYAVTGFLAPIDMPLTGFLNVPTQATLTLTGGQMQALQSSQPVMVDSSPEVTLPKSSLLAIIPRDEVGLRSATQQMPPQAHRALLYLGPFAIRASVRVAGGMPLRNATSTLPNAFFALSDAEIRCTLSGTRFAEVRTPVIIVNKNLIQFFHPSS